MTVNEVCVVVIQKKTKKQLHCDGFCLLYIIIKFECNLKIAPFIILNTILLPIYFEYHYSTLKSKVGLTDNNKTLSETGVYFWGSVSGGICLHRGLPPLGLHPVDLPPGCLPPLGLTPGGSASKGGLHPRLYF